MRRSSGLMIAVRKPKCGGSAIASMPGQVLALLDVDLRIRELADAAHVVEMRMGDDDVGDVVRPRRRARPACRTGEIQQGMSNLVAISAPPPSFMKPLSISTLRSPLRASTKEKGRSITPSSIGAADQARHRLVAAARIFEDVEFPVVGRRMSPSLRKHAAEARQPDGDDQDRALEHELRRRSARRRCSGR